MVSSRCRSSIAIACWKRGAGRAARQYESVLLERLLGLRACASQSPEMTAVDIEWRLDSASECRLGLPSHRSARSSAFMIERPLSRSSRPASPTRRPHSALVRLAVFLLVVVALMAVGVSTAAASGVDLTGTWEVRETNSPSEKLGPTANRWVFTSGSGALAGIVNGAPASTEVVASISGSAVHIVLTFNSSRLPSMFGLAGGVITYEGTIEGPDAMGGAGFGGTTPPIDFQKGGSSACINANACLSWSANRITQCVVPSLKGKRLAAAEQAVRLAHCTVGKVKKTSSKHVKKRRVISTSPGAGQSLPKGTKVNLVVSK